MRDRIISISMENTKMGPIPSFSLLPHTTCNPCAPCVKCGCYAVRMMRRKSVFKSWKNNTDIVLSDLALFKRQLNGWLAIYQPKAFRIHVGGDFTDVLYLKSWCEIAEANGSVKFFAFTKRWDVLRKFLNNNNGTLPSNLSIILSAWTPDKFGWCPPADLMRKFPVAWTLHNGTYSKYLPVIWDVQKSVHGHSRKNIKTCEGHCSECGKCFNLKHKDGDILFEYH